MDNTIASFLVALGFDVNQGSLNAAKKSISDYEKAVRDAEKRVEDARWEGAKSAEEISKLTREANLKEARAALAMAQEREKAEKDQAKKREERNKEFTAGMGKLALAATAAATAISYAVNRVTQAFDNLGFISARTGASVQSLNSLGYAFKQVGGSSQQAVGAVEKFAQAIRQNDGLKSYIKGLGIDTTKDMADQLLDTVDALSKHEYQVGSREAGMLGISEEDYKLLTQYAAKVKEYRAEYDATTKSLGVNSKEAADASMAFQRTLTRLQATVSALGDKLMVGLAPALEAIVRRFQEWISANPEKVEHIMRGIADAVVWLAEKLGAMVEWFSGSEGDAFMKRWDAFADRVKAIASAFETIFGVLKRIAGFTHLSTILGAYDKTMVGILSGPAAFERANGGAVPGTVKDDRRWYEKILPNGMGGKDAPSPQGGVAPGSSAGSLTALYEAEAKRAGIDPRYMHGIRAGESLKSDKYDVKSDSKEDSYGPFQLNRRGGLGAEFEKQTGLDLHDPKTIPAQVRWAAEHIKKRLAANPNYNPGSEWYGYRGLQDANPNWGDSGYKPTQVGGNVAPVNGVGGLEQNQGGATRSQALTDALQRQIVAAATAAGVNAEVYSGGQDEHGPNRTGSHRHDHGNAADLKLYTVGSDGKKRYLSMSNDAEREVMAKFIRESVKAGANGVGAAIDYMGANGIHVGGGSTAAWGAGGASGSAPDWVKRAHEQGLQDRRRGSDAAPTAAPRPAAPNMTPGGFDVNGLMKPASPMGAGAVNNSTSRTINQTFHNQTTVTGADKPREAARVMESAFGNMHGLALANAQSAVA